MKTKHAIYVIIIAISLISCGGGNSSSNNNVTTKYISFNDINSFKSLNNNSISDEENDIRFFDSTVLVETENKLTTKEFQEAKAFALLKDQEKHTYIDIKKLTIEITDSQIIAKLQMKSLDYSLIDKSLADYSGYIDLNYDVTFDLDQDLKFSLTYGNTALAIFILPQEKQTTFSKV